MLVSLLYSFLSSFTNVTLILCLPLVERSTGLLVSTIASPPRGAILTDSVFSTTGRSSTSILISRLVTVTRPLFFNLTLSGVALVSPLRPDSIPSIPRIAISYISGLTPSLI